ncbi:MAG: hypothetical protein ACK5Z5_05640 [Neisseriaceae bacterium]
MYEGQNQSGDCYNINALLYYAPLSTNIKDRFGYYPLFYALVFGSEEAENVLLKYSSHLVIEETINHLRNFNNREELQNTLYDNVYNVYQFKIYYGMGRGKTRKKDNELVNVANERKREKTYTHNNQTYYLHADDHGHKHVKYSNSTTKKNLANIKKPVATFNSDYARNYNTKLSEVIKHAIHNNLLQVGQPDQPTIIDMGEVVGWDQSKETAYIELYYGGEFGSHMRPKWQN